MPDENLVPIAVEIQIYAALLLKFFGQGLDDRLRQAGEKIGGLQYSLLNMLQYETLTISEISRRLGFHPSTLVGIVDVLEREDLARRGSDARDRRRNPITITDKGRELLAAFPPIAGEDPAFQALQSLGPGSATQLRDLLRRLISEFPEGKMVADQTARALQAAVEAGTVPG